MDLPFFAEMAWKSALISGIALGLAACLRSRAAADRARVLRIGVAMLIALPLVALFLPALRVEAWAAPDPIAAPLSTFAAAGVLSVPATPAAASAMEGTTIWDDPAPLVLIAYLAGLFMLGARLIGGLWVLRNWTRAARPVECPEWIAAFDRVRGSAPVPSRLKLLVSDSVPTPLSWGWREPVILIDPDTLDQPEEAEAILVHEAAHVARNDWPVLMLSRIAAALFWFNPLVRLLDREVVQQAEEAADAEVVDWIEPAHYAQTLLSWARIGPGTVPAHAIAPSARALARRMRAILDRRCARPPGSAAAAGAVLLCLGVAAPVSALEFIEAAPAALPTAPEREVAAPVKEYRAEPAAEGPESPETDRAVRTAMLAAQLRDPETAYPGIEEVKAEAIRNAGAIRVQVPDVHMPEIDEARIERAIRRSQEAGERAFERGMEQFARGMEHGAQGMARGAEAMEEGAAKMLEQAAQLRSRAYREDQIAREAERGRPISHEALLELAEGLESGAREMVEAAREMRVKARDMQSQRM